MKVEALLERFWIPPGKAGNDPNTAPLIEALEAHCHGRRIQNRMLAIFTGLLILIVAVALTIDLARGQSRLLPVIGGAGLGIPALMTLLASSMADLSKTQLLLRIARTSDAPTIRALIDKAIGK